LRDAASGPEYKAALSLAHCAGLRAAEVISLKRPFGETEAVLAYLSRSTHRVAMSNTPPRPQADRHPKPCTNPDIRRAPSHQSRKTMLSSAAQPANILSLCESVHKCGPQLGENERHIHDLCSTTMPAHWVTGSFAKPERVDNS
jgi:hypothetical protein